MSCILLWEEITGGQKNLISLRTLLPGQVLGDTLDAGLQKGGYLPEVIQFYGDEQPDYGQLLTKASQRSRGKTPASTRDALIQCWFNIGYTRVHHWPNIKPTLTGCIAWIVLPILQVDFVHVFFIFTGG